MDYINFTIKDRTAIDAVLGTNKKFKAYGFYLNSKAPAVTAPIVIADYGYMGIPSAFPSPDGGSTILIAHLATLPTVPHTVMLQLTLDDDRVINTAVALAPYDVDKTKTPSIWIFRLDNVPGKHFNDNATNDVTFFSRSSFSSLMNDAYNRADAAFPVLPHGEWHFGNGADNPNVSGPALIETAVAMTAADVEQAKSTQVSMLDVFNRWQRYSQTAAAYPSNEANPSELQAWQFDAANNLIRCTVNSVTHIGFISPDAYENYDMDVTVGSNDVDGDVIGIVLAAKYIAGELWTLVLTRSCGGGHPMAIQHGMMYKEGFSVNMPAYALKWGNGNYGVNAAEAGYVSNNAFSTDIGWKSKTLGGRLVITRRGDIITVVASDLNSTELVEASRMTLDLNSHARYAKFKGPARYGFMSQSQNDSYYRVDKFVDYDKRIVDLPNRVVWKYDGAAWVVDSVAKIEDVLKTGRFIRSTVNGKLFFANYNGEVIQLT